ncbi:Tumor necrosis factor receptor superfamily member 19 TRADE Toxicity and JNK inducer Precursor [Larimichthys crocea]|uniref:Tumor necrosis factor receptor superfamily member 19 TRADE Toxicity and JNK inducer n=1 Tax=Larimichthys crocea TaxID=215358 RepID=A0A6G0I2H4_LARCR|nr:Tumor necrosis factor receptor superfamily member 19 TRADE Toxicity and JNK inducer Precursor [Larimichthys crocea]
MEVCLYAALLMVWCLLVKSEPICDQTEFLHPNGTCVSCPVCGPGEQLSEDCGFGDGGEGVCILCGRGKFSTETGVAPCMRCTQCNLLNRLERSGCSSTRDARCGQCFPGYYELRSMTGEVELPCVPCYNHDTVHKECLFLTAQGSKGESAVTEPRGSFKEPEEKRVKEETFSMVLIGSATASSIFLIALLLWAFLLTAERFKQVPEYCPAPEGILPTDDLQYTPLPSPTETPAKQSEALSQTLVPAQDSLRGHENDVHPTSIVINVTTNIKPSSQKQENITQEQQQSSCYSIEEMEQKLQTIWEVAQGQSIEMLDYDSVQDLSLLLDSADNRNILRRLGRSLGVPPQVIAHLQGFQDLFQYLRTSTYTLLPQLAQAAALLPNPEVVARIHRAVVNK